MAGNAECASRIPGHHTPSASLIPLMHSLQLNLAELTAHDSFAEQSEKIFV